MSKDKETPEDKRERMRQTELKNSSSSIHGSTLSDLVGSLGWKSTGILILVIIVVFIVISIFLK